MPMSTAYLNLLRDAGQGAITHIGLVDAGGTELASAGYARKPVTMVDDGTSSRLPADQVFDTTAGDVVAGWRAYSALTGGTDFGGAAVTEVTFANDGTYTLLAVSTSIAHTAG